MNENIPRGWIKTTLGEIAEPSRARALPTEVPEMRYVSLGHIEPHTMKLLGHSSTSEVRSSAMTFSTGAVLYGKMRPYLNKVWLAEFDGLCSAEFLVFPRHSGLNNHFLALRMNSEDFVTFAQQQVSGDRPRVDFEKLAGFPILLPPVAEQERIVTKLNDALSAVQSASASVTRARERLERYRAAVLRAAANGELTRERRQARMSGKSKQSSGETLLREILAARRDEWKGKGEYKEPSLPVDGFLPKPPKGWTTASLEQLTSANRVICYGILMPKEHVPGGVLYVKVRDLKGDKIDYATLPRTSPEIAAKYERASLKPGDILLAIRGTYGRVAEVPPELDGGNITQDTARLAFSRLVERRYVALFLRSEYSQNYFERVARGVAVKGVNIGDVRPCPILLPSLEEQVEIVREVDRRLSAADRLAATLEQQLVHAHETRRSLLRQAFTGVLLPQNPQDAPASLPPKRIEAAHKVKPPTRGAKRMGKLTRTARTAKRSPLLTVLQQKGGPMTPEELFLAAGYTQESVEQFYAELRDLTTTPAKIVEQRKAGGEVFLMAAP
jgi:type I restriction enzyme S subunit